MCVSVINFLPISSKSTVCYLLCGNGLDPHITSHFWRARCWALSREDTGRTRRRKGLFLGLVLPFHFPQIRIPLTQAEAVGLQQVPCAGGSEGDPGLLCHQRYRCCPSFWAWGLITPHTCCLCQRIALSYLAAASAHPGGSVSLSLTLELSSCPVTDEGYKQLQNN